ncbi:MAG: amidophosphoribosyltransferase, partial [Elusimicrobiales bacterium]
MCGIFGLTDNKDSSFLTYIALYSLQHRGQESCGIVSWGRKGFKYYNGMGLVQEVFNRDLISGLSGDFAIGHVRYSTTGSSTISNAQPLFLNTRFGEVAVAHNGNIINSNELKRELSRTGSIFQTTTDSEIIVHLISRSNKKNFIEALSEGLSKLKGAFSFVFLVENKIIAARDPWGFRPLVIGRKGKSFAFASETTALDSTGYDFIGEVEPGEIAVASNGKIKKTKYSKPDKFHRCIFEQVYFARPDSIVLDKTVAMTRYEIGKLLAAEFGKSDADIVSGVPDSGTSYALGFSKESGINYMPVFMKNHYAPRSFLQPQQSLREFIADLKLA